MESFDGARPYSRSQAFGEGMIGGQSTPSSSMQDLALRYNAKVPHTVRPTGTLNGMSRSQYETTLGGAFPVANGIANDTYLTKRYFEGEPL